MLIRNNIWTLVAKSNASSNIADMDWAEMEGLFCQQPAPSPASTASGGGSGGKLGGVAVGQAGNGGSPGTPEPERRRKEASEVTLLDGKRSLNINIFLKQFRSTNEQIVEMIRDGSHEDIGAEKLRGLLKILPAMDEVEMLRSYDGDRTKLGNAEKFLLLLMTIPSYRLRIEGMLLKEEFATNVAYLEPSINAMMLAGDELKNNQSLQTVLYMVVVAGNFLNSGGYAGNAAGVRLASLQKLTDIRANKPGMNLIHFVAQQAEKKDKNLLRMPEEMAILEEATKTTVDQLRNEVAALDARIKTISNQTEMANTPNDIQLQMAEFLQMAKAEMAELQEDLKELDSVRRELADFFCEPPDSFKLEECFKLFLVFCQRFRQGVTENEQRRQQEAAADVRRKQREEQLALKRRQSSSISSPLTLTFSIEFSLVPLTRSVAEQQGSASNGDDSVMDSLLLDIRCGFPMRKSNDKDKVTLC